MLGVVWEGKRGTQRADEGKGGCVIVKVTSGEGVQKSDHFADGVISIALSTQPLSYALT